MADFKNPEALVAVLKNLPIHQAEMSWKLRQDLVKLVDDCQQLDQAERLAKCRELGDWLGKLWAKTLQDGAQYGAGLAARYEEIKQARNGDKPPVQ